MAATRKSRDERVQAVPLYQFEGTDVSQEGDEHARLRGYFPLSPGTPNASEVSGDDLMIVCMEIESGDYLPTHTDSNEELLVVTSGTVEVSIDDDTVKVRTGECAVVPKMVPHCMQNIGDKPARVIGFFPNNELTATFEKTLVPFGTNVISIGGDSPPE